MLSNLFSFLHPKSTLRSPTLRFRPTGVFGEEHFNLLATLQLAVCEDIDDFGRRCKTPSNSPLPHFSAAEMLHGADEPNLRKQGRLCLTFALKNHHASSNDKVRVANELEEPIDAAYSEEDYRHRIYRVGGYLNENPDLFHNLLSGTLSSSQLAVADVSDLFPFPPATVPDEKLISKGMATGWC